LGLEAEAASPKDVAREFALVSESTDEGSSLYLERNYEKFVQERRRVRLSEGEVAQLFEDEDFQNSNMMHGINGLMFANLLGLEAEAETQIRWYVLGLGTETDLHSVHWHGHTMQYGGHRVDVVQNMPATGVTVDMYADHVGEWLLHCHVNEHLEGGMMAKYEIVANVARDEEEISTCQQIYATAADEKMNDFDFDESWFEGHPFRVEISPYFLVAYTVNYAEMYLDMAMAARTTGFLGLGFYGLEEDKSHAMINTDMIVAWVANGQVGVVDCFAQGLDTPKLDTKLGGEDLLLNKEGQEVNDVTYVKFRRSFKPEHLDLYDYQFRADLEQVKVVFSYSSINSDNLVYHGPTRGYSQIPWNTNCSANFFWNLGTSECEGCDRGYYRLPWDPASSLSRCTRCELGTLADVRGEDRVTEECEACGFAHATTIYPGATTISECVCEEGYFHECWGDECLTDRNTRADMHASEAFCEPCPTGMTCAGGVDGDGLKHAQPVVPYGYVASVEDLTVFRCYDHPGRCPGGPVGTCAAGRTGIQCAKCDPGLKPDNDDTCTPCTGGDVTPFVLVLVAVLLILSALYHIIDNQQSCKQTHSLLVAVSGGQMFSLTQMLGAVSMVSVDWPDHLVWLLGVSRLFVFDLELLHVDCLGTLSPSVMFAAKIILIVLILVIICIIHMGFVVIKYRGNFRQRWSSLAAALGTVFMLFFISVVTTVLAPLHCVDHPSGLSTVRTYQTVLCWEGSEHATMILLTLFGVLLPIAFLMLDVWAILVYPARMKHGDTAFLKVFGFLIFRFRAETYWFSLFFLGRNMFISVIPVFPDVVVQTMLTQLTLTASLSLTLMLKPWRVWQANMLDCGIAIAVLFLINLGAFYADAPEPLFLSWLCVCVVVFLMLTFLLVVVYGLYVRCMPRRARPFQFFVCHHKVAAGCFARLLKCMLEENGHGRTFIDCDDLFDLDALFQIVGQQTDTLIIACSREILLRPWCVGEMCTSRTNSRHVVTIIMHDFEFPDDRWIAAYDRHVPDLSTLTTFGITLNDVRETLRWLPTCPSAILPPRITHHTLRSLTAALGQRSVVGNVQLPDDQDHVPETEVFIALDHTSIEAISIGHILHKLLKRSFASDPDSMPQVLPRGVDFPRNGRTCLLICTGSCLQRLEMLKIIVSVSAVNASFVPILADDQFRFPAKGTFLEENRAALELAAPSAEALQTIVLRIFRGICSLFQPMMASEAVLNTNAAAIQQRILERTLRCGSTLGSFILDTPDQSCSSQIESATLSAVSVTQTDPTVPDAGDTQAYQPGSTLDDDPNAVCDDQLANVPVPVASQLKSKRFQSL